MRDPPDRPGHAHAHVSALSERDVRDVDTSNATLNTLLRGSHQKSWMMGGMGTPVRATPRRISSTTAAQPTPALTSPPQPRPRIPITQPVRKIMPPVVLTQTLNDEPRQDLILPYASSEINPPRPVNTESPIPRNASNSPVRQRSGSFISALPRMRPAHTITSRPAIEPVLEPVLEPNTAQGRETWDLTGDEPESNTARGHAVQPPDGATNGESHREVNMESYRGPNGDLNGELRELQISRGDSRSILQFLQSPSPEVMSPVSAQATLPRQISNGSMPSNPTQLQNGSTQPISHSTSQRTGQIPEAVPLHTNRVAPRLPGPLIPSPTLAMSDGRAGISYDRPSVPAPFPVPGPAHTANPPKRQRTQPPVMPSLAPRIALIEAHITSVGGEMNLNTGLERPRFSLLKDACAKEDGFYVATHQIFCAWDVDPQQVLDIVGFPPFETLKVAFKILGQLIRDNSQLAPNHLNWFSRFPSPLPDLLRTSEPYRRTVNSVGQFLTQLAVDWLQFSNDTRARSYPPLVDELVNRLGILSPIFQGIVFTATRRNLGVIDDTAGDKMEKMFLNDRQEHQALAARVNTNRPPTEQEISNRNSKLAGEYYALLRQVRRRQSSVASSVGSLTRAPTPGNANLPPGSSPGMNPSVQRLQQPSPHLTNPGSASASPDMMVNGRQDVIGPPWRTSAASPIMGVMAHDGRRPSAMNSPQLSLHTNSPSPNVIQNPQLQPQQPIPRGHNNASSLQNVQQWGPPGPSQVVNQGSNPAGEQYSQNQYQQAPPQGSNLAMPGQYQNNRPVQQCPPMNGDSLMIQLNNIAQELFMIAETRQARSGFSGRDPPQYEQSVRSREQYLLQQQAQLQQALAVSRTTGPPVNSSYRTPHQPPLQPSSGYTQYAQAAHAIARQPYTGGVPGPSPYVSQYSPPNQAPQIFNQMQQQRNGNGSTVPRPRGQLQGTDVRLVNNPGPGFLPPLNPTGQPHAIISEGAQRMLNQTEAYNQTPIQNKSVVPPYYYPLPAGLPAPHFTALHQAHLRSPLLAPCKPIPKDVPLDDPSRRFYQVVKEFACPPVKLLATQAIANFEFTVPHEYFPMVARSLPLSGRSPETRGFVTGSLQYRMRCVERKKSDGVFPMSEWSLQETSWPDNGVYELEAGMTKQQIELRRKRLHGKDLPVDLTSYVVLFQPTVTIKITMSMPGRRNNLREKKFYLAVEVIEILAHSQIMDSVQQRRQPAQTTKESIRKSLAGPDLEDEDDDDIALVSSELTLDITDPFSARMFAIPVRSSNCHHRECFDLETYLLSRNSKPNRKGQPSMIDIWKCPLCKVDARPETLYVDEYLVDIRNALEEKGERDVKAVLVDMTGEWKVKEVPVSNHAAGGGTKRKMMHDEEDSEDEEDDIPVRAGRNHVRTKSITVATAVIDLSD